MKVGGPKTPTPPPEASAVAKNDAASTKGGVDSFERVLDGGVEAAEGASRAAGGPLGAIIERLERGEISAREARDELVERVVEQRGADLGPEARVELRAALRQAMADDPYLLAKFDAMGARGSREDEA